MPDSVYEFDRFRLDIPHKMLFDNGRPVRLAPKVIETLIALAERCGEVVGKEELMERLWADAFVEESNLTQNIYLLRKALGNGADGQPLIESFRRRGYRFKGEIRELSPEDAKTNGAVNARDRVPASGEAVDGSFFDSLAVLPFANQSADPDAEYLSDGITESIINRLSQIRQLRVVARNTVFRYKNRMVEPQKVGRDLGVRALLTGRVLQFGDRLVIRTELAETANGWQIWGEQYDRHETDILDLQETIAREISENLRLKLTGEDERRLSKQYTESTVAYHLYMKGRYHLNKRFIESIRQATRFFEQAIQADPSYAPAYVGLADCFPLLSLYGSLTPRDAYPQAKAAALKALELDDGYTKAYNSLGVVKSFYEWDWAGAEQAFRRAIEINPGYPDAHQRYGMFLTAVGRFDEAAAELAKACDMDPLSPIIKVIGGYPFYYSRRFDEAARRFQEVVSADADYSMAHFRLGLTRAQQGNFDEAINEFETSIGLSNDRDAIAALGYVFGLTGNKERARKALAELDEREKSGFVTTYNRALIAVGLGDRETALDWLDKAYDERSYWLIYLKSDPALDSLRREPRFAALQEKIFGPEHVRSVESPAFVTDLPADQQDAIPVPSRPLLLAAGVLAVLVVLLLLAVFPVRQFYFRDRGETAQPAGLGPSISLKRLTPDINVIYASVSSNGKYLVYVQSEIGKRSLWVKDIATGGAKQVMPPVEGEAYGAPQISPDNSQIYFVMPRNNRSAIMRIPFAGGEIIEVSAETTSPFAISPDGEHLAFVREQSLIIANADGSGERNLKQRGTNNEWFESWGSHLSFSPDGTRIAVCGGQVRDGKPRFTLTEISVADGGEKDVPVPKWDYLDSAKWIPDGSGLIAIARETSGSPFQIWRVAYPSGEATRVTKDFQAYNSISISADSRLLVAVQGIGNQNIWTAPVSDAKQAKQVTFGTAAQDGSWGIASMPDGRIVYTSPRGGNIDLWIMNADGSSQKQLTANAGANTRPTVSPDGRYIFFQSDRGNGTDWHVWRIDADGGNPKQMTSDEGVQTYPVAAPDAQWVYFTWAKDMKGAIWKIPVRGGEPVQVFSSDISVGVLSVSPDGKLLAVDNYDKDAKRQWQQGIFSAETGEVVRWFDYDIHGRMVWSPDSRSVISLENSTRANLLQHPLDGGPPRPFTNFDAQQIRAYAFSADGKTLILSRGNSSTEAVLITDF